MHALGSEGNSLSVKMVRGLVAGPSQDTSNHSSDNKIDLNNLERSKIGRFNVEINNTPTPLHGSQASYSPSSEDLSVNPALSRSVSRAFAGSPQVEIRNSVEAESADLNGNVLSGSSSAPVYGIEGEDDDGEVEFVRICNSIPKGYCIDQEKVNDQDGYILLKLISDTQKPDDSQGVSISVLTDSSEEPVEIVVSDSHAFDLECLASSEMGAVVKNDDPKSDLGSLGDSYIQIADDQLSPESVSSDLALSVQNTSSGEVDVQALFSQAGQPVTEPYAHIVHESKTDFVFISMDSTDTPVKGVSLPEQFSTEQSPLHLLLRLREGFDQGLQNRGSQSATGSFSDLSGSSGEDSNDSLSTTSESSSSTVSYSSDSSSGDDSGSDHSTYEPAEGRSGSIHMLSEPFLDDKSVDGEEPAYAPSGPEMQHNVSMELFPQVCQATTSANRDISRKEREASEPVLPGWGGTSRVSGRREDSWHKGPADWYDFKQSSKLAYRPLSQGTPRLEATSEESETRN